MNYKTYLSAQDIPARHLDRPAAALGNWTKLNAFLNGNGATESAVEGLLITEWHTTRRSSFLKKLHQRLSTLRRDRERREMGLR